MSDALYEAFGENVRHHRRLARMTQADLANAVSLSRPSIANIEVGRQSVLLHQALEIAKALNVGTDQLVPGFSPRARDIIRLSSKRYALKETA